MRRKKQLMVADYRRYQFRIKLVTGSLVVLFLLGSFSTIFGKGVLGEDPKPTALPEDYIMIENMSGIASGSCTINVSGNWSVPLSGYQIAFSYDAKKIEIAQITAGSVIKAMVNDNSWKFSWDQNETLSCVTAAACINSSSSTLISRGEGILFQLIVNIKEHATNGKTKLDISQEVGPPTLKWNTIYSNETGNRHPANPEDLFLFDGFLNITGGNNLPNTPKDPVPSNQAPNVSNNTQLSWTGGDPDVGDTVTYDVYFGSTNPQDGFNQFEPGIETESYSPEKTLNPGTTYYWHIVAHDSHGASTPGPFWFFTTMGSRNTTNESTQINDSKPTITIITPRPGETIYNQTPLIKASYRDPDEINTSTVTLTIDFSSKPAFATSTAVTYIPSEDIGIGSHFVQINVSDKLGNTNSTIWTFTIEQGSNMTNENLGNISQGEHIEIILEHPKDIIVYSVNLTPTQNMTNVSFEEVKLLDKPENIPPPNAIVYVYLDLKLTADGAYITENAIKSLQFKFKVKKTWIAENNIDTKTVQLTRYHNRTWQNLTTHLIGEDDVYVYYEADTPGCSTFAIVGSQVTEIQPYNPGVPDIPWNVIVVVIVVIGSLLIIVLFKAGYIYKEEQHSDESPPQKPEEKK